MTSPPPMLNNTPATIASMLTLRPVEANEAVDVDTVVTGFFGAFVDVGVT